MKTRDLKISIGPINKRFPDATNEILEPLKSSSNDENLETSDGGEDLVSRSQTPPFLTFAIGRHKGEESGYARLEKTDEQSRMTRRT